LAQHFGAKNTYNTVYAVAIALAESGGNANAISPSHDYGLWQINRIHFGDGIIGPNNWSNTVVNAREMWKLSGGMQNWAAWCTAWVNPGRDCGHGYLHTPQAGSPADDQVNVARPAVTQYFLHPPTGPSGPALTPKQQDEKRVSEQYAAMRNYANITFLNEMSNMIRYIALINRRFT
jgi:hypothetical protein